MSRTLCVAEDPKLVSGKDRLVGDTVTLPPVALPSIRTVWVLLGKALSVIVNVAFLVVPPGSGGGPGVNVIGIVQLWPG